MMGRRANKPNTSSGIPSYGNISNNLVPREFTSFSWLGTLSEETSR